MLKSEQYKRILRLDNQGQSIRSIRKITGHSRNTIRKVLDIRTPPPFKICLKPSILDGYTDFIKEKFDIGTITALEIYKDIKAMGYKGSYLTVRRHMSKLSKEKESLAKQPIRVKKNRKVRDIKWLLNLIQGRISLTEIEEQFRGLWSCPKSGFPWSSAPIHNKASLKGNDKWDLG
jgi:transposase